MINAGSARVRNLADELTFSKLINLLIAIKWGDGDGDGDDSPKRGRNGVLTGVFQQQPTPESAIRIRLHRHRGCSMMCWRDPLGRLWKCTLSGRIIGEWKTSAREKWDERNTSQKSKNPPNRVFKREIKIEKRIRWKCYIYDAS